MSYSYNRGQKDFDEGRPPTPQYGERLFDPLFGTKAEWEKCGEDYEEGYDDAKTKAVQEYEKNK